MSTPTTWVRFWFETSHESDHDLPMRLDPERHDLWTVPRKDEQLIADVKANLPKLIDDPAGAFVWIACDTRTTRTLTSYLLKDLHLPKDRVKALGYWLAT